jgi:hypothetical protein
VGGLRFGGNLLASASSSSAAAALVAAVLKLLEDGKQGYGDNSVHKRTIGHIDNTVNLSRQWPKIASRSLFLSLSLSLSLA